MGRFLSVSDIKTRQRTEKTRGPTRDRQLVTANQNPHELELQLNNIQNSEKKSTLGTMRCDLYDGYNDSYVRLMFEQKIFIQSL